MSVSEDVTATLRAEEHGHQPAICIQENSIDRTEKSGCQGRGWTEDVSYTLNTTDRPAVFDPSVHHGYKEYDDVSETVRARYGTGGNNQPLVVAQESKPLCMDVGFFTTHEDQAGALLARNYKDPPITYQDKTGALMASGYDKLGTQEAANDMYITNNVVRRLTPMECERLQGFPDGWTDIPGATDSKRYKALGNSIALPFWEFLAKRFVSIGEVKTIGSLFDGIGGFPLVFKRAGAETLWTSEIDSFCQKVVEYHVENGDL